MQRCLGFSLDSLVPPLGFDWVTGRTYTCGMEVRLKPETEARLQELANRSGRAADDLVEDAMSAYLVEVAEARNMLDTRYEEFKSGKVKPIDGEAFFENLRRREQELLKKPAK